MFRKLCHVIIILKKRIEKSKGSVSQLMDDLDLINSVEQVQVMVNSTQTGTQNQKTSALVMLENLLSVFLICSTLFRTNQICMNTLLDCVAPAHADKNFIDRSPNQVRFTLTS